MSDSVTTQFELRAAASEDRQRALGGGIVGNIDDFLHDAASTWVVTYLSGALARLH